MTALNVLTPVMVTSAMLTSNVPEPATGDTPDPAAWAVGTTYALGARVHVASTHMIYESVQAANLGNDPTTDTTATWWVQVSATNRYRMFDQRNSSQTTRVGGIDVTVTPNDVASGLALLNLSNVTSAVVTMTDPTEGTVYDQTHALQDPPTVGDYYEYCFDPIVMADSLVLTDLPSYRFASIRVQFLAGASDVAGVGVMALGRVREIGIGVQMGARVGIQDYSRKEANAYGDYTIVQRAFSKRASIEMWVPRAQVDSVQNALAALRATPAVWIANDYYKSLVVYGFYKDFDITIAYHDYSVLTATIEGLT